MTELPDAFVAPSEHVQRQATDWFARREEMAQQPALRQRFEQWQQASPEHAAAYQTLETLWQSHAFEQALRSLDLDLPAAPARPVRTERKTWRVATAAMVLMMLTSGWLADLPMRLRADQITAVAEVRHLTLDDGSQIVLGSHSAISTDINNDHRRVRLLRGELYVEAFHDPSRPLTISAADATVTVVGTQFSVGLQGSDVTVSVREGNVRFADPTGEHSLLLAGNWQQLKNAHLQAVNTEGAERQMAWVQGRLSFQDQPLAEVLNTLGRYYPQPILLFNDDAAKHHVSGNYQLDNPVAIVEALNKVTSTQLTRLPGGMLVIH
ncbi:FecR family protein [Pseudomonas sp. NPDC096917]|uniref:FecR family protein n=1 Tax=Pseudomonas sp. NPDC096917 TaxID=3364483 RepID=UPI00383B0CC0